MIETPCIGICSTVYGDDVCRGCKRRFDEVIHWNGLDDNARGDIWKRLNQQASQAIEGLVVISDEALLQQALDQYQIRLTPHHESAFKVCLLLKQAADQIDDLSACGLSSELPVKELSERVDDGFYGLAST